MGVIFLGIAIILINIGFWAVFLARFKKMFSTDDIISSVRTEMNHMIADVQRNTSLNVDLIENRIRELRAVTAEADRHLAVVRGELQKQEESKILQNQLNAFSSSRAPQERRGNIATSRDSAESSARGNYAQRSVQSYLKVAPQNTTAQNSQFYSEQTVSLTPQGQQAMAKQGDLFDQVMDIPKPQTFTVKTDGTSYAAVPVVAPEVTFVDNPVTSKKDFAAQVNDLARVGQSVEEIASTLGRSIQEVQFVLDMGL